MFGKTTRAQDGQRIAALRGKHLSTLDQVVNSSVNLCGSQLVPSDSGQQQHKKQNAHHLSGRQKRQGLQTSFEL